MSARESIRLWSIALGLSALIHVGLVFVLSGQSRMMRSWPAVLIDLLERPAPSPPRDEDRPAPARRAPRDASPVPPAPRSVDAKPPIEPTSPVGSGPPEPVTASPPTPGPSPAPGPSPDATPSAALASAPPAGPGSRGGTAPSLGVSATSGTSTDGITQWARPRGGYQVHPSYPATARRSGIQGTTRLRIQVLADGRVGEILVETSAGHPDLDHAAIDAVRQWRFEPARRGAEPVASWALLPVEFHLQ